MEQFDNATSCIATEQVMADDSLSQTAFHLPEIYVTAIAASGPPPSSSSASVFVRLSSKVHLDFALPG